MNRRRPLPYHPDTGFNTFFSRQVLISSDLHIMWIFPYMPDARTCCQSWPDCALVHFRNNPATWTWQQIDSKIGVCHSTTASILELTSILVWFIYQIIHSQSLLQPCNVFFGSQNIAGSASDRCHLGSESGMTLVRSSYAKISSEYPFHIVIFDS